MQSALEQWIFAYPETTHWTDVERLYAAVLSRKDHDIYESIEEIRALLTSNTNFNENEIADMISRFETLWYFLRYLVEQNKII